MDGQVFELERELAKKSDMVNNFVAEMDESDDVHMELPSVNCELFSCARRVGRVRLRHRTEP